MDELKVRVFVGRERFRDYLEAVQAVEGGTISPGGAAQRLHCSRQFVHKLCSRGRLRAWMFYEAGHDRADYVEIAAVDVEAYAEKYGKGEPAEFAYSVDKVNRRW